jgi:hypothetical protein
MAVYHHHRVSLKVIFYFRRNRNSDEILLSFRRHFDVSIYQNINFNCDVENGISISICYFQRNRNSGEISSRFCRNFEVKIGISVSISNRGISILISISNRNFDFGTGISIPNSEFQFW